MFRAARAAEAAADGEEKPKCDTGQGLWISKKSGGARTALNC